MKQTRIMKTAVNRALQSIKTYEKNVAKGSESHRKSADAAIDTIKQFLNKDGTISKSKTRSAKAKSALNEAVASYLETNRTKKTRQTAAAAEKQQAISDTLKKRGHLSDEEKARQAAEALARNTKDRLKKYGGSPVIVGLSETGYNADDIDDILNYIDAQIENDIPDELAQFHDEDDVSVFISYTQNLRNYDPTMSGADAVLLAEYMQSEGEEDAYLITEAFQIADRDMDVFRDIMDALPSYNYDLEAILEDYQ